jgi:hypothetical protein
MAILISLKPLMNVLTGVDMTLLAHWSGHKVDGDLMHVQIAFHNVLN